MSWCPVCKRARCEWVSLKADPSKVSTEELKRVLDHNNRWIEMEFSGNSGSAHAEERAIGKLQPYAKELDRRGK